MEAILHKDYAEEKKRLEYTINCVKDSLIIFTNQKKDLEDKYHELLKHYDPRNNSQAISDLMINENMRHVTSLKIRNLKDSISKPYFARIDFQNVNDSNTQNLYIGKVSLVEPNKLKHIIVDWRAPISNLYYEGKLGQESYESPNGLLTGDLKLKRQFIINKGLLNDITDTDVVSDDELLKQALQSNVADNRLKDIVATIQIEQNKIIREKLSTSLIVQGSAGSGKTTIALHRIAYLIYTYNKSFKPSDFMIIGPNKLFLNYISNVLPELGVEDVKQTTVDELFKELVNTKYKVENKNSKLLNIISSTKDVESSKIIDSSKIKSSLIFKEALEVYMNQLEQGLMPNDDLVLLSHLIITKEEVKDILESQIESVSLYKRIDKLKQNIALKMNNASRKIVDVLDRKCAKQLEEIRRTISDPDKRQKAIIDAIDKKNNLINIIEKKPNTIIDKYLNFSQLTAVDIYTKFLNSNELQETLLKNSCKDELIDYLKTSSLENLTKKTIESEDIAPLMYIQHKVNGIAKSINAKHIIVDEAQDLSPFQFAILKQLAKDSSFTILGDICQGIYSYNGINNWNEISEKVFEEKNCKNITLDKSYRTTIEIMNAANEIIPSMGNKSLPKAMPIIRHGEKVEVIRENSINSIAKDIIQKVDEMKKKNYKSIAIICKTPKESKSIFSILKKYDDSINLITEKQEQYEGGCVVIPSFLSKGLEFDGAIIPNASNKNYENNDIDAKLLYVSMTRPLHKLYIYFEKEPSELISSII